MLKLFSPWEDNNHLFNGGLHKHESEKYKNKNMYTCLDYADFLGYILAVVTTFSGKTLITLLVGG